MLLQRVVQTFERGEIMATSTNLRSTPVHRSWASTFGYLIGAIVVWYVAIHLGQQGSWGWAILPGLLGFIFLLVALVGSGSAPCPNCGTALSHTVAGFIRCPACGEYAEIRQGRAWELEEDRVAPEPTFAVPLPEQGRMPGLCCACGAPATHHEPISIQLLETGPLSMVGQEKVFSVDVPHCDRHTGGAILTREAPAQTMAENYTEGSYPVATMLQVKSYRFYREFLLLNREPAERAGFLR